MNHSQIALLLVLIALVAMPASADAQRRSNQTRSNANDDKISFVNDVAPIINDKCGNCHVSSSKGRYGIKSYTALMDSNSVTPRDPDDSYFIEVIENGEMPKGGKTVSDRELETLRQWIEEGAKFDGDDEAKSIGTSASGSRGFRGNSRGQRARSSGTRTQGSRAQGRSSGRRPSRSDSRRGSQSSAFNSNKLLKFLDKDGDGQLSLSEIDAISRLLHSLDRNRDDRLTPDEVEEFGDR